MKRNIQKLLTFIKQMFINNSGVSIKRLTGFLG